MKTGKKQEPKKKDKNQNNVILFNRNILLPVPGKAFLNQTFTRTQGL